MKTALFLIAVVATCAIAQRVEPPRERGVYHAAAFPTIADVYRHKGWRYEYLVQDRGTRSESRNGRLFLEEREITGQSGELLEEFLGRFIYFGTPGRKRGWLNTLTYDRPVFEQDGSPTSAAHEMLKAR